MSRRLKEEQDAEVKFLEHLKVRLARKADEQKYRDYQALSKVWASQTFNKDQMAKYSLLATQI